MNEFQADYCINMSTTCRVVVRGSIPSAARASAAGGARGTTRRAKREERARADARRSAPLSHWSLRHLRRRQLSRNKRFPAPVASRRHGRFTCVPTLAVTPSSSVRFRKRV